MGYRQFCVRKPYIFLLFYSGLSFYVLLAVMRCKGLVPRPSRYESRQWVWVHWQCSFQCSPLDIAVVQTDQSLHPISNAVLMSLCKWQNNCSRMSDNFRGHSGEHGQLILGQLICVNPGLLFSFTFLQQQLFCNKFLSPKFLASSVKSIQPFWKCPTLWADTVIIQ